MLSFREVPVTDDSAHQLLTEYFASRAETFPTGMGAYVTVFPEPASFAPPRGVFLVLSEGQADLGCGGIRLLDHAAGVTRFEVKHLWVRPEARGAGRGGALLAELEARARAFGASELVLDTNVAQEAAGALYRGSGYAGIAAYNSNPNATHWFAKNLTTELE